MMYGFHLSLLSICRLERDKLHDRALEATLFKHKSMSLLIDGMDQYKTHLPAFAFKDKDSEKSKVQVHITGSSFPFGPRVFSLFGSWSCKVLKERKHDVW